MKKKGFSPKIKKKNISNVIDNDLIENIEATFKEFQSENKHNSSANNSFLRM